MTRIKLLIKGYSFSQASEILSLTKEQENEILSHDKLDHITNWIANSKKVSLYDEYEKYLGMNKRWNMLMLLHILMDYLKKKYLN